MCEHYRNPLDVEHRHYVNYPAYDNCVLCLSEAQGPMTQEQIGEILGVTKEWISQIERRAMRKLRLRMSKVNSDDLMACGLPTYERRSQISFDRKSDFSGYLDCNPLRIND